MALVFVDSFDHYATANREQKWTSDLASGSCSIAGGGRDGSRLQCTNSATATNGIVLTVPTLATYVVGFAFLTNNTAGGTGVFLEFYDGTTLHVDLRITAASQLQFTRNGTVLATGSTVLSTDAWYFIEVKVTIGDAGSYEVRINGVTEVSSGSADTRNGASAQITRIALRAGNLSNGPTYSFDDFYILNTSGGAPTNDFLGDVRVQYRAPDGNGNSSQFDGSDGNSTDNYLLVDDSTPDSDTTYVESPDVSDKDTYTHQNLSAGAGAVYGVQVVPFARKTDAGARSICTVARLSATETDSADKALSTSYLYYLDIRETKPGGGAWTISDVNSAEFGQKVTV